jgi:hypothetical protein
MSTEPCRHCIRAAKLCHTVRYPVTEVNHAGILPLYFHDNLCDCGIRHYCTAYLQMKYSQSGERYEQYVFIVQFVFSGILLLPFCIFASVEVCSESGCVKLLFSPVVSVVLEQCNSQRTDFSCTSRSGFG